MTATLSNNLIWHGKMLIAIWAAATIKIMPLCFDDDATWNLAYDAIGPPRKRGWFARHSTHKPRRLATGDGGHARPGPLATTMRAAHVLADNQMDAKCRGIRWLLTNHGVAQAEPAVPAA